MGNIFVGKKYTNIDELTNKIEMKNNPINNTEAISYKRSMFNIKHRYV